MTRVTARRLVEAHEEALGNLHAYLSTGGTIHSQSYIQLRTAVSDIATQIIDALSAPLKVR